jgi:hypothetical protein
VVGRVNWRDVRTSYNYVCEFCVGLLAFYIVSQRGCVYDFERYTLLKSIDIFGTNVLSDQSAPPWLRGRASHL